MFRLLNLLWKLLRQQTVSDGSPGRGTPSSRSVSHKLEDNVQWMVSELGNSSDLIVKPMSLGGSSGPMVGLVYLKGMGDVKLLLQSLQSGRTNDAQLAGFSPCELLLELKGLLMVSGDIREVDNREGMIMAVLCGDTIILAEGCNRALAVGTGGGEKRAVEEPNTQSVIRGPREGFTETLSTNTALVRRKIKDARIRLEGRQIGRITKTDVAVMYLNGVADDKIVKEVHERLDRIDIDGILESGYIEELIQDKTFTPFPTIYNTERPDAVAAALLEGRVAIFVDGTPFVLLVPALFMQFFQTPEDYYQRADFSTLLRILRFVSFFISLLAPALYVGITTFHQELLPTPLLIGLAGQREGVPFPAFVEAMLMEMTFEILREAGVRMPKTIGQSVSIVGTLVIGQAAVEAGLVSPAMVMVVSLTAISNFVIPAFNMGISTRMLRFVFIALSASFGLFGIVIGLIGLVLHLCSLRSFGVPYLSPFAPLILEDQKDTLLRVPMWFMLSRPKLINQRNIMREQIKGSTKPKTGDDGS